MASSMSEPAAVTMKAAETQAADVAEATAETDAEEEEEETQQQTLKNNDTNNEKSADDATSSTLHTCANDPDFAVICAFLQKFSKDLGFDLPNFKHLQEWLVNTDEVAPQLRDFHMKLLRKTRKTVHEKSWEGALSKFCFTYSAQDAWEIERFGYKKSSLKVKLRILLALLESQFERNAKFRANILTISADSLRAQPIGRDRLGHAYWLTQDNDCNLRIYQEHLDEDIWQVVATNRDEFVKLIARLRGNEVVLPSNDIGVVDEDSSSNSCAAIAPKPPPPVEQDDSQEDECAKVPTMRIKLGINNGKTCVASNVDKGEEELTVEEKVVVRKKLKLLKVEEEQYDNEEEEKKKEEYENTGEDENEEEEEAAIRKKLRQPIEPQKKVKPLLLTQGKVSNPISGSKKRTIEDVNKSPQSAEIETNAAKKLRPSLMDSKRSKTTSKYDAGEEAAEDDEGEEDLDEEDEEEEDIDSEGEESDIDSAAAEEGEDEDKEIEDNDDADDDYDDDEGLSRSGVSTTIEDPKLVVHGRGAGKDCEDGNPAQFFPDFPALEEEDVGEIIEEDIMYFYGTGSGADCLVGNTKNEAEVPTSTASEPKATFFFGEPGCLKLSPMKNAAPIKEDNNKNAEKPAPLVERDETPNEDEKEVLTTAIEKEDEKAECVEENNKIVKQTEQIIENDNETEEQICTESVEEKNETIEILAQEEKPQSNGDEQAVSAGEDAKTNGDDKNVVDEDKDNEKDNVDVIKDLVVEKDVKVPEVLSENGTDPVEALPNEQETEKIVEQKKDETNESEKPLVEPTVIEEPALNNVVSSVEITAEKVENPEKVERETIEENVEEPVKSEEQIEEHVPKSPEEQSTSLLDETPAPPVIEELSHKDEVKAVDLPEVVDKLEEVEKPSEELKETPATPAAESPKEEAEQEMTPKKADENDVQLEPEKEVPPVVKELATNTEITATTKSNTSVSSVTSLPNRKRRLPDLSAAAMSSLTRAQSTSDSEVDFHSEQHEVLIQSEEEQLDVGGKRLKMRGKHTNAELRKKVEAQKVAVEETTSSSGEEDARRRRKIITPKWKLERHVKSDVKIDAAEQVQSAAALKLEKQDSSVDNHASNKLEEAPKKAATCLKPGPVKQKPTLAEIIEKKLRKTTEQLNTAQDATVASAIVSSAAEASSNNSSSSLSSELAHKTLSPPKKSPITKPLKKNLLTQLRQEESDEDATPRKRSISAVVEESTKVANTTTEIEHENSGRAAVNLRQKTPERCTLERQRKRRSSDEVHQLTEAPTVKHEELEGVSEKHQRITEEPPIPDKSTEVAGKEEPLAVQSSEAKLAQEPVEKLLEAKKETSPAEPAAIGRRSSRRGGTAVVHSELPQVKRNRGAAAKAKKEEVPNAEQQTDEDEKEQLVKRDVVPETKQESASKALSNKTLISPKFAKKETKVEVEVEVEEKTTNDVKVEEKETSKEDGKEVTVEPQELVTTPKSTASTEPSPTKPPGPGRGRGVRKKREVDTTNIIEANDSETPVRQSRRIAQLKIREEAERRKLEEIALRSMKQELKKKKKAEKEADPSVLEPSEHSSTEESEVETKRKVKKKCPGKDGWSSGSEEQEEPEDEEEEEPPHYDTDPGSPLFKSDHEFSPESDLEDESQVVPMKRARTARKEDAEDCEEGDEEACQNCGKSDHPEWILLCDKCDKGYHCSCLSPVLFYIPEGDWYCPPCQQEQLIVALEQQLKMFDELVECKRLEEQEEKRLAQEAERLERERLEEERLRRERRKQKKQHSGGMDSDSSEDEEDATHGRESKESYSEDDEEDEKSLAKLKDEHNCDKSKRRRGDARSLRRAARRGVRRRNRRRHTSREESGSGSDTAARSGSNTQSDSSESSAATDSDDEPIYKLRKRRQINVSYRLNEYDEIMNSALKKEMDEVAGAGNLGRGKDITTIIEADKEEKARKKQLEEADDEDNEKIENEEEEEEDGKGEAEDKEKDKEKDEDQAELESDIVKKEKRREREKGEAPVKKRSKPKPTLKKKSRKLTTLDISSEEDNASDEDFKTTSLDEDEDEDTTFSGSSESDSSLEIYKRKAGKNKDRRRAARERRKDRKFVFDDSEEEEEEQLPKSKKKRKEDSDYTESEDEEELSELSENVDSADLCDDTTSESSDGPWQPSKKNKKKGKSSAIARKSPKLKKPQVKKKKRSQYSDDDVSESEEEEDDDYYNGASGKGSGKQPRSQPLKPSAKSKESTKGVGKGKGKGKGKAPAGKSQQKHSDEDSFSDSGDSTRRTRGRRYAYLEDFDDDSSDGGIKPGVKRPDTPPEEREKFIQRQEEIKRMLAEKNAEGAKLAATPRLTPIKATAGDKDKRSPAKPGDSLSTVPLSVIRQAKVLDKDYLQRMGEPIGDLDTHAEEEVDEAEFDDADLQYDFPEDMDEDAIARMVEEEDFGAAAAATRELPAPDEVVRAPGKPKSREGLSDKPSIVQSNPSLAAMAQMPGTSTSGLQEPVRKRLPMPTLHPPLLRHQPSTALTATTTQQNMSVAQMLQRNPGPPTYLLQNALSAPLGQPINRNFTPRGLPPGHQVPPHLMPASHAPPPTPADAAVASDADAKPRGRRKKITPLRDALQKQQAAAAASTASSTATATSTITTAPKSGAPLPSAATVVGGVIKSPLTSTSVLSVAQPPQLYKPPGVVGADTQPSVIQRMPLLPPHAVPPTNSRSSAGRTSNVSSIGPPPPGRLFSNVNDVARFYGLSQQGLLPGARPLPPSVTQRIPRSAHSATGALHPQLAGLPPHNTLRPTYGPPPPLRGSSGALPNHAQPPTTGAAGVVRSSYVPSAQSREAPPHSAYAVPPPARHAAGHLNPYR